MSTENSICFETPPAVRGIPAPIVWGAPGRSEEKDARGDSGTVSSYGLSCWAASVQLFTSVTFVCSHLLQNLQLSRAELKQGARKDNFFDLNLILFIQICDTFRIPLIKKMLILFTKQ